MFEGFPYLIKHFQWVYIDQSKIPHALLHRAWTSQAILIVTGKEFCGGKMCLQSTESEFTIFLYCRNFTESLIYWYKLWVSKRGCNIKDIQTCLPTPVFLPGESHGWRSLMGYSPRVAKSQTWLSDFTSTTIKKGHLGWNIFMMSAMAKALLRMPI